jgi:FHS family glucose/mannose:H+ symporter-like MFS transporter
MHANSHAMNQGPGRGAATAVLHAGFIVTGVVTVLLGPILPLLIARWSMSDANAGLFFTTQFVGTIVGVATLGLLIRLRGYRITFITGYVSMMAGVAGLNLGSEVGCVLATAAFGYGLGLVLAASNLWVAEVATSRRAAALSILNAAWGIGAIACPALVVFAQRGQNLAMLLYGIAGFSGFIALLLATMKFEPHPQDLAFTATLNASPAVSKQTAFALGAMFYLYVGAESCVSGWVAAFAKRMEMTPGNLWALTPMFFWSGLLAGRALAPVFLRRLSERALLASGLILATIGNAALLSTATFRGAVTCAAVTGLGMGATYPLLVSRLIGYYGERAKRSGSVMFALAALGGATMPWLVGFTSTQAGSLRAGLLVPIAGCLAMISLLRLLRQQAQA